MARKENTLEKLDALLHEAEVGEKLSGKQRIQLRLYCINSAAGAGNSEFSQSVLNRMERIRAILGIQIPDCVSWESPSAPSVPSKKPASLLDEKTSYSETLRVMLQKILRDRSADAILLSGGIDSSLLAALDPSPLAITVGYEGHSDDLIAAQEVTDHLGMRWHRIAITIEEMRSAVQRLVALTKSYDIGLLNDIPVLLGMEHAAQCGCRKIRTGEAADFLFAGYSSGWHAENYAQLLRETIPKIVLSTSKIGTLLGLEVQEPFFAREIREFALTLPDDERVARVKTSIPGDKHLQEFVPSFQKALSPVEEHIWSKIVVRRCALGLLPIHLIYRQKQDLQYGSGAYFLSEVLEREVPDNLYETLHKEVHPFYNKAHSSLYLMYKQLGLKALSEELEVTNPCNWCGAELAPETCHCATCGAYEANLPVTATQSEADIRFIEEARVRLPLISILPDWILKQLDTEELALPDTTVEGVRRELEDRLRHYIMTYKRDIFKTELPPSAHLCNWIKGAELDEQQRGDLAEAENKVKNRNVSFVVYQKPLEIVPPSSNPLRIEYLEHQQELQKKGNKKVNK